MARTDIRISPCAEMKTIGRTIFDFANSCWNSSPLSPGSLTSRTRHPGASGRLKCRNSSAVLNVSTFNLIERKRLSNASLTEGSSSTTNTMGLSSFTATHRHKCWKWWFRLTVSPAVIPPPKVITLAKKVAAVVGNSAFASQGIFNLANLVLSHKRPIKKDGPHSGPEISRVSFLLRTCSLWLPSPDWGEGEHVRC